MQWPQRLEVPSLDIPVLCQSTYSEIKKFLNEIRKLLNVDFIQLFFHVKFVEINAQCAMCFFNTTDM